MADPLSIATSCVGLISAAGSTISAITAFVRTCREARGDLTAIARELADLQLILELLKEDGDGDALPHPLQAQILGIVKRCAGIVANIKATLKRYKGRSGAFMWAVDGKKEVEGMRRELEAYRGSLSLTVETVTLFVAKSIKEDTEAILDQTQAVPDIKRDTERILEEIRELRISKSPWNTEMLDNYLDGLTTYAETVCEEEVVWESADEDEDGNDEEEVKVASKPPPKKEEEEEEKKKKKKKKNKNKKKTTPRTESPRPAKTPPEPDEVQQRQKRQQSPSASAPERKCDTCKTTESAGGPAALMALKCGHQMCEGCIRTKYLAALHEPYERPRCCSTLPVGVASKLLDKRTKNRFNKIWAYSRIPCPAETCKINSTRLFVRDEERKRVSCGRCNIKTCSWCDKEWHAEPNAACDDSKSGFKEVFS